PPSSRSRRNATAEKPAISVPSTSKNAPTAGPAGASSIPRVIAAWSTIATRSLPPARAGGRARPCSAGPDDHGVRRGGELAERRLREARRPEHALVLGERVGVARGSRGEHDERERERLGRAGAVVVGDELDDDDPAARRECRMRAPEDLLARGRV